MWLCKCQCGNQIKVTSQQLSSKKKQSCGCLEYENRINNMKIQWESDLTGFKVGKLTVIKDTGKRNSSKNKIWLCKCECGNYTEVIGGNLTSKRPTLSCGCLKTQQSWGQQQIEYLLKQHNINYKKEYLILNSKYRFDFAICNRGGIVKYIIEYDGIQHFQKTFNNVSLEYVRQHDLQKNKWCKENNLPLIRIPYTHKKIQFDDLCLPTSNFIYKDESYYENK